MRNFYSITKFDNLWTTCMATSTCSNKQKKKGFWRWISGEKHKGSTQHSSHIESMIKWTTWSSDTIQCLSLFLIFAEQFHNTIHRQKRKVSSKLAITFYVFFHHCFRARSYRDYHMVSTVANCITCPLCPNLQGIKLFSYDLIPNQSAKENVLDSGSKLSPTYMQLYQT